MAHVKYGNVIIGWILGDEMRLLCTSSYVVAGFLYVSYCLELGQKKKGSVALSFTAAFCCFVGIVQRSIRVNIAI